MSTSDPDQSSSSSECSAQRRGAHCSVFVCTSCRPAGSPREPEDARPGFLLYKQLRQAIAASPLRDSVEVRPAECLSVCRRPCGLAVARPGSWTYLFGDQDFQSDVDSIVECLAIYLEKSDGFLVRAERPKSLRASILGRVPPQLESSLGT